MPVPEPQRVCADHFRADARAADRASLLEELRRQAADYFGDVRHVAYAPATVTRFTRADGATGYAGTRVYREVTSRAGRPDTDFLNALRQASA